MNQQMVPVLLGGDSNVYGMARSFYEEYGVRSHVICKGAFHICENTKLIVSLQEEPNLEDGEVFVSTLVEFAKRYEGSSEGSELVLVPCADGYAKLLVEHQDQLRTYFSFSIMSPDVFAQVSSKEAFYQTCKRHGLKFPGTATIDASTWADFDAPYGFPCILKPSSSVKYWNCSFQGKKKAFIVRNRQEFDQLCERIYSSDYDDSLIVQEFIPGDDSSMRVLNCYSDQSGKVTMMTLGQVLLEEQTPMGIGSYGAIITAYDDTLCDSVRGFLEGIGYVGFSNFDIKRDSRDGSYKFFEINPRQGRSSFYVTASGMNLARYLVRDVVEHEDKGLEIAQPTDEALWLAIPFCVLKRYVSESSLIERAKELKRKGKVAHSYWAKYDRNLRRLWFYALNQIKQVREYARWFGKRHIDD